MLQIVKVLPTAKQWMKTVYVALIFAVFMVITVVPAFAQEEDLSLDIDIGALFDGINNFLPIAFSIFALIGGILIAFRLARFIINAFADALDGKSI